MCRKPAETLEDKRRSEEKPEGTVPALPFDEEKKNSARHWRHHLLYSSASSKNRDKRHPKDTDTDCPGEVSLETQDTRRTRARMDRRMDG
ncbi:MFS general substrate transporter [Anopheles sinensis]|uniref:MFS general substrate transporter n=1 Tax=Anopheles sinensis TaxID=74873 RepID=A0A084VWQ6_ANOSI|nr:MFS general substrate transporter [Anopheles sinensis]